MKTKHNSHITRERQIQSPRAHAKDLLRVTQALYHPTDSSRALALVLGIFILFDDKEMHLDYELLSVSN